MDLTNVWFSGGIRVMEQFRAINYFRKYLYFFVIYRVTIIFMKSLGPKLYND